MRFASMGCVVVCLIAMSAIPARAQAPPPKGGVELGVNAAYLTVPKNTNSSHSVGFGFVGGLFVDAPITKTIAIQPEIQFSQRRSTVNINGTAIDKHLDYLSVPILVRMPLFAGMTVNEGIALHFPVHATSIRSGVERDFKDTAKNPDMSIVIGVGFHVSKRANVEVRWDSGLRQIEDPIAPGELANRNRAITGLLVLPF